MDMIQVLSKEFEMKETHVANIIELIDGGNTIPFIARYRKEMTGACDDQKLRELSERLNYLRNLEKRKEEIIASITEQEKMTDELMAQIGEAQTLARLEDIYRPYKQKRRTRATVAKEKGLEPLADAIWAQDGTDIYALAPQFVNAEKEVNSVEEAIEGAKDIVCERMSDDAACRDVLRRFMQKNAFLVSASDAEEKGVYEMYYDYREPVNKIPGHRVLAVNRGEKEDVLKVSIEIDEAACIAKMEKQFIRGTGDAQTLMLEAAEDAFKRLIFPSLEREIRGELTEKAAAGAISVFGLNLKALLMQPPIKGKTVLGLDPAYRTGCKIAVVDKTGKLLDWTVVYPTPPQNKIEEAKAKLKALIKKYDVDVISIGNGTASKESEIFVAELIGEVDKNVQYMVVNEAGASVYSASKLGAQEFPDHDVAVRSAVSIARRLQDPLAELVKIDPKSIGVGQYQHDMPPKELDSALGGVVEASVNSVGVDVNTASPSLLSYVSGLSATTAKNVVAFREENGEFTARTQLKKVAKLGPKAYEQCAGFLRIPGAKNVLDNTAVHPESYAAAEALLAHFGYSAKDALAGALTDLEDKIKAEGASKVAELCGVGVPTLHDIAAELIKPGRDLRDDLPAPMLRSDVMDMNDLKPGMEMKGTVRNVIDFGVFVDIGVHQDGLVHISQITDRYIKHPSEVLKVGDVVTVYVISVDVERKRIALTMKKQNA